MVWLYRLQLNKISKWNEGILDSIVVAIDTFGSHTVDLKILLMSLLKTKTSNFILATPMSIHNAKPVIVFEGNRIRYHDTFYTMIVESLWMNVTVTPSVFQIFSY